MVPKSVQRIESKAFYGCKGLRKVVFEEGSRLEEIASDAFAKCNPHQVVFTNIFQFTVFQNCKLLDGVTKLSLS